MQLYDCTRMETAEPLSERLGVPAVDAPYGEKIIPSRHLVRRSTQPRPKQHIRNTAEEQKIIYLDELHEGKGLRVAEVYCAKHSLEQILDMLQASGEIALYSTIEKPTV